jgi:hypothetical protein
LTVAVVTAKQNCERVFVFPPNLIASHIQVMYILRRFARSCFPTSETGYMAAASLLNTIVFVIFVRGPWSQVHCARDPVSSND